MRVTINGSGAIVTHGDTLSGDTVIEFPINEPPEFASTISAYTVTGSAPSRKLKYQGHEIAVETPSATAERAPSTGLTVTDGSTSVAATTFQPAGAVSDGGAGVAVESTDVTATGTGVTASANHTATASGGDAEVKSTATTDVGGADVTRFATVTDADGGQAVASSIATSQAHSATANSGANVNEGSGNATTHNDAVSFDGNADASSTASAAGDGNADASSTAFAAGDGNATVSNFAEADGAGLATADITAFSHAHTAGMKAEADATSARIGFFGATPVARPAAPVTLGDVIAALKALGLVAP
jgi:hypothetical protein